MKRTTILFAIVAALLGGSAATATDTPDQSAIRHRMMSEFDKPEQRLAVDPVVVSGPHAIAGWSQGDRGGRALLRKNNGTWIIVLCAGDDLKKAAVLTKAGLAHNEAATLASELAAAERSVAPERLSLFSKFEGLVMLDADGSHPPAHGAHGGHNPHGKN